MSSEVWCYSRLNISWLRVTECPPIYCGARGRGVEVWFVADETLSPQRGEGRIEVLHIV